MKAPEPTTDVLVTRRIPEAGTRLLEDAKVRYRVAQENEEEPVPRGDLLAGLLDTKVLLCLLTEPIDRAALEANPRLLGVANMAVGFNNIDVDAATELGIPVTNTPGVLTDTTADCTWAMLLAVARRIPEAHEYMVAGRYKIWGPNLFLGADIGPGASGRRKVLGIVGYGRIGQAVARRAIGFDMDVLAHDPVARGQIEEDARNISGLKLRAVELDELLAESDYVSLHPPLTAETHHLIGPAELEAMKPTAYLINTARGPIIDERALVVALREKRIAGAALDVYEDEPAMAPGLAELDNAVLLPHIASASHDTRGRMASMAAANALAHLNREQAPDVVNPGVYDTSAYRERAS